MGTVRTFMCMLMARRTITIMLMTMITTMRMAKRSICTITCMRMERRMPMLTTITTITTIATPTVTRMQQARYITAWGRQVPMHPA